MTDPTRNTGLIGVYARRGEWDERYMQQEKKSKVTAAEKGLYKGQRFSDCQVLEPDVPGKVYGPAHREILETPYPDDNSRSTVMATELTVQHERAFLKQPVCFLTENIKRFGSDRLCSTSSSTASLRLRSPSVTAVGTRMLVLASRPPRRLSRVTTSVSACRMTVSQLRSVAQGLGSRCECLHVIFLKDQTSALPNWLRPVHTFVTALPSGIEDFETKDTTVHPTPKGRDTFPNGLLTPTFPIDKKCPFTGMVSIRGRILTGVVVSAKMHRTIIVRREYLHFIPKYQRYEKRHKNLAAHVSPAFRVQEGDVVTVGQCRPLSKTVRFNVLKVSAAPGASKKFAKF
ncbi:hypothetical protein G7K_5434-t2 [Saitoella complicata NRRL Y-17804]|uniref:Small ribosomal subunit protein uS17 n=1 Tax=Saitoella complicata (strain BCRC 22490 / CBS 7301 / JCM 7358 / NBRC 10748 / NRRL Y-17804) TaxID=698492 RepID=A0A0E9NNQ8_SAICN|nr:hypothetical protein G7K_5434-t2 [Saitoella complicata NRRL Y-17804]